MGFFLMKFYIYAKAYEHDCTPSPTTELEVYSYMLATHLFFSHLVWVSSTITLHMHLKNNIKSRNLTTNIIKHKHVHK